MKNSKNVYELLNEITFNIDNYGREELTDLEKQKLRDNYRKKRKKKFNLKKTGEIAAAIVLTLGVFSLTDFGQNIYAATQSAISEITYSIGEALGIERNIEPYRNVVNQIVENNGVEVKLTEVIIDKDELIFSAIINTDKPVEGVNFDWQDIFINGKRIISYTMSGSSREIEDTQTLFVNTYSVDISGIETKETIDIKIVFRNINYFVSKLERMEEGKIKGKWGFEFTGDGSELMTDTYGLPLDYTFNIDEQSYKLDEFRYNPVSQKIQGTVVGESEDSYDIELRGNDNLGNEINFYLSSRSNNDLLFKYQRLYKDFPDGMASITLTPYAAQMPKESGRMSNDYEQVGEAFTIVLNQ